MNILAAILLSISCNLDNIIFGMNYGVAKIKIPFFKALVISFICAFTTFVGLKFGNYINRIIDVQYIDIFGNVILILIGAYFILKEIFLKEKSSNVIDKNITMKQVLILAMSLSLNNMPIAIAGGISNLNSIYTVVFSFVFSTLFIYLGNIIGGLIKSKLITFVASGILMVLGILELLL